MIRSDAVEDVGAGDGPIAATRRWLLTILIVVILPTVSVTSTEDGGQDWLWLLAIAVSALILVLGMEPSARVLGARPPQLGAWAAWSLALAMLIALAVNPPATQAGVFWTVAALVGAAAACSIARLDDDDLVRHVTAPLGIVVAVQGAVMAAQLIAGDPLLLGWLWPDAELRTIDEILRPQGTFVHVFEPALLATVAMAAIAAAATSRGRRRSWQLLAAATAVPVGLSFSRSAAVAAVAVIAGLLLLARARSGGGALPIAVAMAIGLVVSALAVAPGWLTRLDQSTSGDVDDVTLGRITLARQALEMIGDNPITGVGTAKYIPTLESDYEPDPDHPFAVHNFPLRVTAEVGIPLGLLVVAITIAAGVQSVRAGIAPATVYLMMVPWLLFDILYYDRVFGLLTFGVWWGLVAKTTAAGQRSRDTRSS